MDNCRFVKLHDAAVRRSRLEWFRQSEDIRTDSFRSNRRRSRDILMRTMCLRALCLVAVLVLASPALADDAAIDSPEQKVLDQWLGHWHTSYRILKAEWTPEEKTGTAELVTMRVVGGRFVQEKSEHSDKTSGSLIFTFDDQKKCYRVWWFSSTGQTSESTGRWDAGTRTMTWTSVGETRFSTTVRHRFLDSDTTQWDVTVNDNQGKVLFRMEGKSGRVKTLKK